MTQRAYVFPAVIIEEWNLAVATMEESMLIEINGILANYMVPTLARGGTTVYVPSKFVDKVMRPKEAEHQLSGGSTTIASIPGNHLPIDQHCGKKPVMTFHFSDMYGVLKYPVKHKEDIEEKCSDKIPPDDSGRRQAENVKLVKACDNTTSPEHPCSEQQTKIVFLHKADELGDYWKTTLSPKYQPLTVDDAIWGNKFVPPMDLDTSTGADFQMLFPGKTKKKHLLGERGEFLGDAGAWLRLALSQQWDHWKRGEVWLLPGSYSLKAECLPLEKVWKKRISNVCDPVTTINSRRLMMPFQTVFTSM